MIVFFGSSALGAVQVQISKYRFIDLSIYRAWTFLNFDISAGPCTSAILQNIDLSIYRVYNTHVVVAINPMF